MIEAMALVLLSIASPGDGLIESLRKCREIEDDHSRLECFDEAFLLADEGTPADEGPPADEGTPAAAEETPADEESEGEGSSDTESSTGSQAADEETRPADGPTTAVAVVLAKGGGRKLSVRCDGGEMSVAIDWGQYLNSESPEVTVRIDSLPPSRAKWARSEDKNASLLRPSGGKKVRQEQIAAFVSELIAGRKLAAQVIPRGQTAVTAVFDLSGAKAELRTVRRACW